MIAVAATLVLIVGPLLLASAGWFRAHTEPATPIAAWDTRLTLLSVLLYTLAFNLVFFVQELFLVLPKAFTPALRPTLFHNNQRWEGEHALAVWRLRTVKATGPPVACRWSIRWRLRLRCC